MLNPTLAQYTATNSVDQLLAQHYEGHSIDSALQHALWSNSSVYASQGVLANDCVPPQPCVSLWSGMDNPDVYGRNLSDPIQHQLLVDNGWIDQTITYSLNSWGFRSDCEYDAVPEPCVVVLGCSFSYGVGLHEHQIWPEI